MILTIGFCVLTFALLFIDLSTKAWAAATHVQQRKYFLGLIKLNYTENKGIAFGIASDNRFAMIAITAFTVVLIITIAVLFFTVFKKNRPIQGCLAVIEAGAIGNLVDRLCLGYVRDFVDVSPTGFGICNLADFFITFGAVALCFVILFIGPSAVWPLKKKWREEAKRREAETKKRKTDKDQNENG